MPASLAHPSTTARRPRAALGIAAICLGFLMITLDATIVNVALRPIESDLGGSLSDAQWVVNGYTLAFAALLLSAGALADRLGARAGYLIGLGIFALGSAACSIAGSVGALVAARVVQGCGAAWLMPCSLALIAHLFPAADERRRALAIWAGVSGIGLAGGPILGGVLTAAVGWRAIFLVNLPVAAVAAVLLVREVPESHRHRHPLDPAGQAGAVVSLALTTCGFILAGRRGWSDPVALAALGGGAIAAIALTAAERAVRHPMIDPALFRRGGFGVAVAIGLIFNLCLYGGLFCLTIDLTAAHGLGAFDTGIAMLPMTVTTGVVAYLSGRIVARVGEWRAIAAGMGCGLLGAALVTLNAAHGPVWQLAAATVPIGCSSMAMAAMTAAAMNGVPAPRVGLASGVLNTARQTGGALGVAALGALLRVGGGVSLHVVFPVIAGAYALGGALAVVGGRHAG